MDESTPAGQPRAVLFDVDSLPELAANDILFVSRNGGDAIGATWFGDTTLCVNRFNLHPEQLDTNPTRTGTSLRDVLSPFDQPTTA